MNKTGGAGEDAACVYLEKQGYKITGRNYHSRYGEIDIIALKDGETVFCEVKTRSRIRGVKPCEYVNEIKQKKIIKTALTYLGENADNTLMRFDVIDILYENGTAMIKHYKNVF